MSTINERFTWAVEVMSVQPTDTILEIGCGTGILAGEVASKFTTGCVIAIDKSAPMIMKAEKRNKKFIESGRATFKEMAIEEYSDASASFDKIVAFK